MKMDTLFWVHFLIGLVQFALGFAWGRITARWEK
jgi:hypothetical protein